MCTLTRPLPPEKRGEDRSCGVHAREQVDYGDPNAHWPSARLVVGKAGDAHKPAHALDDEVVAGAVRVGSVLAEASYRGDDQPRVNPRLIVASITGFGQDGPYADRAGYDFIIQGMSGLMSVTGLPDDQPGGGPMRVGVAVIDLFTGMYTATAILAALFRRERTGEGAQVDAALFDTSLAMLANQVSNALVSGKDPPRQGNTHPNIVPYQPFEAEDKPLIIAVGNDRQFAKLAELCGHPEWAKDERFASNAARVENRADMVRAVGDVIRRKAAAEWFDKLDAEGIPAGPINTIGEALADIQAQHRQMVRTIAGVPLMGSPLRMDGDRADSDLPPPGLGQHTNEILRSLSLDPSEIARLKSEGITG